MADYGTSYPGGAVSTNFVDIGYNGVSPISYFDTNNIVTQQAQDLGIAITTLPTYTLLGVIPDLGSKIKVIQSWVDYSIVLLDSVTKADLIHNKQGTPILGFISGTILEDNAPTQKLVQAFRRVDGAYLGQSYSSAVTGVFNIYLGDGVYLDEITVIAQGGPNQNARIIDKVLPIATGGAPA